MNRGRHKKYNGRSQRDIHQALLSNGYTIINDRSIVCYILRQAVMYSKGYRKRFQERISTEQAIIHFIKYPYDAFNFLCTKDGPVIWEKYIKIINRNVKRLS